MELEKADLKVLQKADLMELVKADPKVTQKEA